MKLKSLAIFGLIMLSLMLVTGIFAAVMQAPSAFTGFILVIAVMFAAIGGGLRPLNQVGAATLGGDALDRLYTMKLTHTVAVVAGDIVVVGGRVVEACGSYAANAEGVYIYRGKRIWPKEASLAVAAWAEVYWDATNNVVTTTAAGNMPIGFCCEAAAAADTSVVFQLLPLANGMITQPAMKIRAVVALSDADATLTATQMIDSTMFKITPTVGRALTTATAALLVAGMKGCQVGSWFDFSITCLAAFAVTLGAGANVTLVGSGVTNNSAGSFRAVFTNVNAGTEAVTIHRIA